MNRRPFTILSALSLLFVGVSGCSSQPADRDGVEPIDLVPRLTDEGDLYRVHIDFVYRNLPEHHGLVEF